MPDIGKEQEQTLPQPAGGVNANLPAALCWPSSAVPVAGGAFLAGVALRSWFAVATFPAYVACLGGIVAIVWFWRHQWLRWLAFGVAAAALGVLRYGATQPPAGPQFIGSLAGREVALTGVVLDEPDVRLNNTKLTIGKLVMTNPSAGRSFELPLPGKLLVTTRLYPEHRYGDVLRLRCKLEQPEPFDGFAYDRYLARQDIYALCYYPTVATVGQEMGHPLRAAIYSFKAKLQQAINRGMPEPAASLLSAIVLGSRRGLPSELISAFNVTGLTHVIAISGAQITLLISLLGGVLPYLGVHRKVSFYLTTAFLVVYLVLIGAPASAVRAGVMGWLLLFAGHVGRMTQAWRLLLYAGVAMVALNPKILRDDVGFQLSFAAVAGLVYLQPLLQRWLVVVPENRGLRAAVAMTLAASVFTLPVVSAQFGRVSVAGLLANVLVFAIPTFAMVAGLLALPLAFALPVAWHWLLWLPVTLALSLLVAVAEMFARVPGAALQFQLPGVLVLPAYLALAWAVRHFKRWLEERERYQIRNS